MNSEKSSQHVLLLLFFKSSEMIPLLPQYSLLVILVGLSFFYYSDFLFMIIFMVLELNFKPKEQTVPQLL